MAKQSTSTARNQDRASCCPTASALARQKFNSFEKWLYSERTGVIGLRGVELGMELHGRELLRLMLQAHVEGRGDGDVGAAIEVFDAGASNGPGLYSHKRIQHRRVVTLFGEIVVVRVGYGLPGENCIHPLDEALELPGRLYSYELQRRLVKKAVQGPFDEAVDSLCEATGAKIPKRTAQHIVLDASEDFDRFYASRHADGDEGETGSILVGSVDCKGIPMIKSELTPKKVRRKRGEKAQKKKMATVAAVFTQLPRVRTPEAIIQSLFEPDKHRDKKQDRATRPQNKRIWASLTAGKDSFISDVNEEMKRRDPLGHKLHVVVTDGERALQLRVLRIINGAVLILDLLHVLEKLWKAAHGLYAEASKDAEDFVRIRAFRILKGEVSQVVKGLRLIATKRKLKGSKHETLHSVANYFYNNRSRMRYDEYLAQGLPIASGSVEGACKNLIKDRMERSGMRWSREMAEAMVKMRATYLSGDFDEYWDYHVTQDLERLYPKNRWKPTKTVVVK